MSSSQFPDPAAPEPPPRIALVEWRPMRRESLRGFATVRVSPGLVVHDLPVHKSSERLFALWPGKPQVGTDGRVLVDEHGKRRYSPIIEVPDRDLRERLSNAIITLVQRHDPQALS